MLSPLDEDVIYPSVLVPEKYRKGLTALYSDLAPSFRS
jgi:hypothetical protein